MKIYNGGISNLTATSFPGLLDFYKKARGPGNEVDLTDDLRRIIIFLL